MHSNESKLFPMLLKWSVSSVESCRKFSRVTLRSGYQRELEFGCLFQDWINISGSSNTVLTEFLCLVAIRCSSVVLVKQQQQQKKNLQYLLNSAMRVWNMVLSFRLGNMGRALAHFFFQLTWTTGNRTLIKLCGVRRSTGSCSLPEWSVWEEMMDGEPSPCSNHAEATVMWKAKSSPICAMSVSLTFSLSFPLRFSHSFAKVTTSLQTTLICWGAFRFSPKPNWGLGTVNQYQRAT